MRDLLYPLDEKLFFEKYWLKEPFLSLDDKEIIPSLAELVSLKDVERLISSLSFTEASWFQIVKPGVRLDTSKYLNESGFIDLTPVIKAYASGYTLLFSKVQKRIPKVADLVREYEKLYLRNNCLFAPARASMILTPKSSVGFPIHYDDYDIFILQVSGEKNWFVYDKIDPYPPATDGQPVRLQPEQQNDLKLLHNFNMKPGNWCYLPRGYYHNAKTHNHHSMHVVIAAKTFTVLDLLARALEASPRCRQPLPVQILSEIKNGHISAGVIDRITDFSKNTVLSESLQTLREKTIRNLDILPEDSFSSINDLEKINSNTVMTVKKGMILELIGNKLLCGGVSSYVMSDKNKEIIPFIQKNRLFKVTELPKTLIESEKIEFVKQLVLDGILTIAHLEGYKQNTVSHAMKVSNVM